MYLKQSAATSKVTLSIRSSWSDPPHSQTNSIKAVRAAGEDDSRVTFLGGVWDQNKLDALYAGALTYIHGHSVGGTNPSLLRAMGAAATTIAYDVNFNRETLGQFGQFPATRHTLPHC